MIRSEKIAGLLADIRAYVPFYMDISGDLNEISPVTKADLNENWELHLSKKDPELRNALIDLTRRLNSSERISLHNQQIKIGNVLVEMTSGTTGIPSIFPKTVDERNRLMLGIWRARRKIDPNVSMGKFAAFLHLAHGEVSINVDPMDSEKVLNLYTDLWARDMTWLHALTRSVNAHIETLKRMNVDGRRSSFRYVETGGQYLNPIHASNIQEYFGCQIVNLYGTVESWVIGFDLSGTSAFDIVDENVVVEILDCDGSLVITEAGIVGRVVVTSLHLRLFPIVRYVTSDLAMWQDCADGRRLQLVEGRGNSLLFWDDALFPGIPFFRAVMKTMFSSHGYFKVDHLQFSQSGSGSLKIAMTRTTQSLEVYRAIIQTIGDMLPSKSPIEYELSFDTGFANTNRLKEYPLFYSSMPEGSLNAVRIIKSWEDMGKTPRI